ncbi:DegV family protein [Peribacillus sp. SCS-26]|uniref:DegV family protein n=1 Tax=Paraperibacillus marinus TaxID=3115295 RepID=UPI003906702B
MRIAWVTDSTVSLDEELLQNDDVYTVPLQVLIEGQEYRDGIDITPAQMFAKMKLDGVVPTTSQPSVGTFLDLYSRLKGEYDCIIAFHVSGALSGTFSSSLQAAGMTDCSIYVIDTLILTYPMAVLIKKAMKMAAQGMRAEEIVNRINRIKESNKTYVLIGSLEQLHRSGRMSGTSYYVGSILNIKPIISIDKGKLSVKEKVRSRKKAKQRILSYLEKDMEIYDILEIYILYGLHEDESLLLKEELEAKFPSLTIQTHPLGTTIGVHAGEDTLGISWYNDSNL